MHFAGYIFRFFRSTHIEQLIALINFIHITLLIPGQPNKIPPDFVSEAFSIKTIFSYLLLSQPLTARVLNCRNLTPGKSSLLLLTSFKKEVTHAMWSKL